MVAYSQHFFTVTEPVAAEALNGRCAVPYPVVLLPGQLYATLSRTPTSLFAASTNDYPEVYLIPVTHPAHWHRFTFTDDGVRLP